MKISVIIPVYNSEKYLSKCVDSILTQSYKDFEVILIDDESTDRSPALCDEYAQNDSRVKVIHKKNGGTADSRNVGLSAVTGDYITFMDNDDYWNSNTCLYNMVQQLTETKADILLHYSTVYWENKNIFESPADTCDRDKIVNQPLEQSLKYIIQSGFLDRAVWSKVIKSSLIKDNQIHFPKGMRNEDTYFTGQLLLHAKSFDYYNDPFYVYRKGHTQAQTSKSLKYSQVHDLQKICTEYIQSVENNPEFSKELKKIYLSYIAYPYCVWIGQSHFIKTDAIKADVKEMRKYSYVINNNYDPYVKLISKVYKLLGFKITSKLLYHYINKKYYK